MTARELARHAALLNALQSLCDAIRDYDRFGSDDDLAERNRCMDVARDLLAKARGAI